MSLNGLTGTVGLKLGPLVLETLVKHYFERLKATQKIPTDTSSDGEHDGSASNPNLRQEELLYDQAFTIIKVSITRFSSLHLAAALGPADCMSHVPSSVCPWLCITRR